MIAPGIGGRTIGHLTGSSLSSALAGMARSILGGERIGRKAALKLSERDGRTRGKSSRFKTEARDCSALNTEQF